MLHHHTNVSSQVTASTGNIVYNRATQTYNGTLTVKNNGSALTGKIDVVLDGMIDLSQIGTPSNMYSTATPKLTSIIPAKPASSKNNPDPGLSSNATLTNATGSNNGEPMIQVSSTGIAAGASVSVPLTFKNPTNALIKFNPVTYQE